MHRCVLLIEAGQLEAGEVDEGVRRAASVVRRVGGAELEPPIRPVAVVGEATVLVGGRRLNAVHAEERAQVELADLGLDAGEPSARGGEDGAAACELPDADEQIAAALLVAIEIDREVEGRQVGIA